MTSYFNTHPSFIARLCTTVSFHCFNKKKCADCFGDVKSIDWNVEIKNRSAERENTKPFDFSQFLLVLRVEFFDFDFSSHQISDVQCNCGLQLEYSITNAWSKFVYLCWHIVLSINLKIVPEFGQSRESQSQSNLPLYFLSMTVNQNVLTKNISMLGNDQ